MMRVIFKYINKRNKDYVWATQSNKENFFNDERCYILFNV